MPILRIKERSTVLPPMSLVGKEAPMMRGKKFVRIYLPGYAVIFPVIAGTSPEGAVLPVETDGVERA